MAHVTLIGLPFTFQNEREIRISHRLGILSISASLMSKGHTVTVIDALFEGFENRSDLGGGMIKVGLENNEIISRIPKDTDMVGVSVSFSHLATFAHELTTQIKTELPKAAIVMGGVYPSSQPEAASRSDADYMVVGEGEIALCKLLDYIQSPDGDLPAGVYSLSTAPKESAFSPTYVDDLNALPRPARELVDYHAYVSSSQRTLRPIKTAPTITSRGCPYSCEFCSVHPVCGYKWRPLSAEIALEEIYYLYDHYGVRHLEIEDDNFTLSKKRAIAILSGIIRLNNRNIDDQLTWSSPNGLRIDTLDEDVICLIKESNCIQAIIALEHGDPEILGIMNKKLDLEKVVEVVGLLAKYNINTRVFTIYCYPGENRTHFENSLAYYRKLKKISPSLAFSHFIAQPYPGTKLYKRCVALGYIKKEYYKDASRTPRFSTEHNLIVNTPDFDPKEQMRRKKQLLKTLSPLVYYKERLLSLLPLKLQLPAIRAIRRLLKK